MVKLISATAQNEIYVPTKPSEVTGSHLEMLTKNFNLHPDYCVVALIYRIPISAILYASRGSKSGLDKQVGVTVMMAKNGANGTTRGISVGDILTVDRSVLERGHHLGINTAASLDYVASYINSDEQLFRKLQSKEYKGTKGEDINELCILSFKVIPTMNIVSSLNPDSVIEDPFKVANRAAESE